MAEEEKPMTVEDEIAPTKKDETGGPSEKKELETGSPSRRTVSGPAKFSEAAGPSEVTEAGGPSKVTEVGGPSELNKAGDPLDYEEKPNPTRIMMQAREKPSKTSTEIVSWILNKFIRKARFASKFEILLVNIQPKKAEHIPHSVTFRTTEDFAGLYNKEKTHGSALLQHLVGKLQRNEVLRRGWIRKGRRHKVICKEAEEKEPDLLIVEGPRPDPVHRMFHKNISKYCLKHAKCPVLVFPFVPETQTESRMAIRSFDATLKATTPVSPGRFL